MLNKILVFGGLSLAAILIVENMIVNAQAFVFITRSSTSVLSIASIIIGIGIGFGLSKMMSSQDDSDNSLDF